MDVDELGMQKENKIYLWIANVPFEEGFSRGSHCRLVL